MSKRKPSQKRAATDQQVRSSHRPMAPVDVTCDDLDGSQQAICETTAAEPDDSFIDYLYTEATESDQPRAAALAGYRHRCAWPPNAGHGPPCTA